MRRWTFITAVAMAATTVGCTAEPLPPDASDDEAIRLCLGGPSSPKGIDVSRHQGTIDWDGVKGAGMSFGFARVSDGTRVHDQTFVRNWQGMRRIGLRRGAYQFFRPGQSAERQADEFAAALGRLGAGDLPPVLDLEISDGQSDATIVRKAHTWLERVEKATGRKPIVYTASGFFDTLSNTKDFKEYPLWVANFGATCPRIPPTWKTWTIWQNSDRSRVRGIKGPVDANRFGGALSALDQFAQGERPPSAASSPEPVLAVDWTREATGTGPGCYRFTAKPPASTAVEHVEYWADETVRMGSSANASSGFEARYCFKHPGTKPIEAHGFDAGGKRVAFTIGSIDVTPGTGIYVRKLTEKGYEIGLERPSTAVTTISVSDGKKRLVDTVSKQDPSPRKAVLADIEDSGDHTFTITTMTSSGRSTTARRTVKLQ